MGMASNTCPVAPLDGKESEVSMDHRRLVPGEHIPPLRRDQRRKGVCIEYPLEGVTD
jgi:hypothetical protein